MKKEYIKPEIAVENIVTESILALSDYKEGMGSNEEPGGQDKFNANYRRGSGWGSLWE